MYKIHFQIYYRFISFNFTYLMVIYLPTNIISIWNFQLNVFIVYCKVHHIKLHAFINLLTIILSIYQFIFGVYKCFVIRCACECVIMKRAIFIDKTQGPLLSFHNFHDYFCQSLALTLKFIYCLNIFHIFFFSS